MGGVNFPVTNSRSASHFVKRAALYIICNLTTKIKGTTMCLVVTLTSQIIVSNDSNAKLADYGQ